MICPEIRTGITFVLTCGSTGAEDQKRAYYQDEKRVSFVHKVQF
jgi:hypothetical protein